jgi:hypothetical protein
MDFDDQLVRYFGTTDLGSVTLVVLQSGRERLVADFSLERDRERRLAMWAVLHILGSPPELEIAFEDRDDRETARDFMDMLARSWDS